MKELSIEEKAKRYDEAIKKVNDYYEGKTKLYSDVDKTLNYLFPALKESEDERIRKSMTRLVKAFYDCNFPTPEGFERKDLLAWLEKQGEQNHTDKVEPKFKVGDTMRTLQEAKDGWTDGMPVVVSIDEEYYHCTNELIAIKDQDDYEFPPINVKHNHADKVEPKFHEGDIIIHKELGGDYIHNPHKIIQVDILDKKYRLEGGLVAHFGEQEDYELVEQKPAWSEEDDKIALSIEQIFDCASLLNIVPDKIEKVKSWFKSIKDRVQPQPKQEWSEEDENVISLILSICNDFLESFKISPASTRVVKEDVDKIENWLKSLRPQNRWKPSEEQMQALWSATEKYLESDNENVRKLRGEVLESLYEDLKKLREE